MIGLYIALGVLLLPVLLVCAPVAYTARAARHGDGEIAAQVKVAYLLFSFTGVYAGQKADYTLRIAGVRLRTARAGKEKKAAPPSPARKKVKRGPTRLDPNSERNSERLLTYGDLKIIINLLLCCFRKMKKVLRPARLSLTGVFGTGDPYYTGLLLGLSEMAAGVFGVGGKARLTADFDRAVLTFDACVSGRIIPARLAWPLIWLAFQQPVRVYIKKYLRRS